MSDSPVVAPNAFGDGAGPESLRGPLSPRHGKVAMLPNLHRGGGAASTSCDQPLQCYGSAGRGRRSYYGRRSLSDNCIVTAQDNTRSGASNAGRLSGKAMFNRYKMLGYGRRKKTLNTCISKEILGSPR